MRIGLNVASFLLLVTPMWGQTDAPGTVLSYQKISALEGGFSGVLDGRHRFDIEASPTGTRLIQSESLDGVLVRFLRRSIDTRTKSGFEALNVALKARAESAAG